MKILFLLSAAVFGVFSLSAAELILADKGKSSYQIVVPESCGNKHLDHYITLGGRMLRTAFRKATGAKLVLVSEKKKIPGRPAIYVGNTEALKKAGLSSRDFADWEHAVKVVGKDIFIYGKDTSAALRMKNIYHARFVYHKPGSLKGCCTFAEKFLNTRVVDPRLNSSTEHDGVRTIFIGKAAIPDKFSYRSKPRFTVVNDQGGALYTIANNYCMDAGSRWDVHYIDKVIPPAKYAKTHPEYFALLDGKRYLGSHAPQYCMSNREVQELVFKDALRRADIGYNVVELGQQDGFKPCQCKPCEAWYGVSDWGEKMWLFQRDLTARLQKARPGIKVGIACYGITHCVPKSYDKFPGKGVYIDIAPARRDLLEKWKKFNLLGMVAWTYNMGQYLACGYSPADSFEKLRQAVKFLRSTPVTSLYLCGHMQVYSINGPWRYAWGKFMADPDLDAAELLKEYCRFSFGEKAAPVFVRFFTLIDKQMTRFPLRDGQDFNDLEGRKKRQSSLLLWQNRYPPHILKELCSLFEKGIKLCDPENSMLPRLKVEFEYLKLSASVCNAIAAMNKNNTAENRCLLADALEKRNAFIKALPVNKQNRTTSGFCYTTKTMLHRGGYMAGIFGGAFNSDPRLLRQNAPETAAVKVSSFSDPAWKKAPVLKLQPLSLRSKPVAASFRIGYTDKALLLKFEAPAIGKPEAFKRDETKMWRNSIWEIFVANGSDRRQFAFTACKGSAFDKIIYGNNRKNRRWNGAWSHQDTVENGVWRSQVTIPFAACGRLFEEGMRLQMQIAFSTPGAKNLYAWYIPLSGSFADLKGFGGVRFGKRPAAVKVDINGDFSKVDKRKMPLAWRTGNMKMELLPGKKGSGIRISTTTKKIGGLYSARRIFVEPDEALDVTLRVRGKGAFGVQGQWRNNAGQWVQNDGFARLSLKNSVSVIKYTFTPGHKVQKNAAYLTLAFHIYPPGGEAVIESITARLRKIGSDK